MGEHNAPLLPRLLHLRCIQVSTREILLRGYCHMLQIPFMPTCYDNLQPGVGICSKPPRQHNERSNLHHAKNSHRLHQAYCRCNSINQKLTSDEPALPGPCARKPIGSHRCKRSSNRSVDFLFSDSEAAASVKIALAAPALARLEKHRPPGPDACAPIAANLKSCNRGQVMRRKAHRPL